MRIIFYKTTGSAMFVNVGSKAAHSFCSGKGLSEKASCKGFEQRWHGFGFPDFL
jgi:hypothetical protein